MLRTATLNQITDGLTQTNFCLFFRFPLNKFPLLRRAFKTERKKNECALYVPNLNSPKLPQPIFFPTRKFGPTINIPDELTECLAGYNPLDDLAVAPVVAVAPPPLLVRITSVRPPVAAAPL